MNLYDDNECYLIEGHVLNRILAIAGRINMDNAFTLEERRELAQEIHDKLNDADGPVDLERLDRIVAELPEPQEIDLDPRPGEGCGFCGGPLELLGIMGALAHYRCRDCGALAAGTATEAREGDES